MIHKATGIKYAAKCLDIGLVDSTEGLRQLRNEIAIMCQLDYPSIVRIEEVYESANEIYIVQELCLGGDLFDRLDEQPDYHYTEAQCAKLVKQMLSSVRYLHSKGIIHRDLKLENFLFSNRKADSELKMIDFGLSKWFDEQMTEKVGTPYTVAPEIIQGKYNEKSDIWALGVITYLLLSGETPFGGLDGENLLLVKENIMRAKVLFEPKEIWDSVSDAGKNFVKKLLNPDPTKRPTAKEAQRDPWIQIWAKKDVKEGKNLNKRTITALLNFKEQSDMQKLLSEVLSFTLLPEQIVELRGEFEKIDTDGDGEISLVAMKKILMENAEQGALGALSEEEIEGLFDAIKVRKHEPTIRWHEFLAAGLSNAKVDDRNLRLAFDRLDTHRRGYITLDNLKDLLGNSTESEALEKIWVDSLEECSAHLNRITFDDFKRLMKGQSKEKAPRPGSGQSSSSIASSKLAAVPETGVDLPSKSLTDIELRDHNGKKKSASYEGKSDMWDEGDKSERSRSQHLNRAVRLVEDTETLKESTKSPLVINRAIYRKHREMRMAVLEASKQFDKKRIKRQESESVAQASLIMKRGAKAPAALEDEHTRALFEAAARRCGRARRTRNKTVSDVTGMLLKSTV